MQHALQMLLGGCPSLRLPQVLLLVHGRQRTAAARFSARERL
jgi:hypothetical protein